MGSGRPEITHEEVRRKLKAFPSPTKSGKSEDGWESFVWQKGPYALRFRMRAQDFELNEYERGPKGIEDVRLVMGSFAFCHLMAGKWFEKRARGLPGLRESARLPGRHKPGT